MSKPVVEKQVHHGRAVWTDVAMDALRRERCLCLRCSFAQCRTRKRLYDICVQHDRALAVTRCPDFTEEVRDE